MPNKVRLFPPGFRILDAAGVLITTGAKIYIYQPTSTTPATTYSDYSGGTPLSNPHTVPSTGIADMWGTYGTAYRVVVKTPADVTLADMDYVVGVPDGTNIAVLGNITVGTLTATTITGTTGAFIVDNAANNTVTNVVTVTHTTSGTPGAGIGTGIAFKAESADESPSDVGQVSFAFSDITSGSEDSSFTIFTRTAGAALKKAYNWGVTGVGDYVYTGAPTATRTITLPDHDWDASNLWKIAFSGPTATTRTITIADADLNISGIGTGVTIPASANLTTVYAKLGLAAVQALPINSAYGKLLFDTVTLDNKSWWDATNKRFTPQLAGAYMICAGGQVTAGDALGIGVDIYKNGASIASAVGRISAASTAASATPSVITTMNGTTDYIEVFAVSYNTASALNTSGGAAANYLCIHRIGNT